MLSGALFKGERLQLFMNCGHVLLQQALFSNTILVINWVSILINGDTNQNNIVLLVKLAIQSKIREFVRFRKHLS